MCVSQFFPSQRRRDSFKFCGMFWVTSVEKTTAILKRAMTEKSDRRKSREWNTTKTRWQQLSASSGRQSSVDNWEQHAKTDTLVKEKKSTWTKSGRESAKRESDLYDMLEKAATKGTGISLVTS